MKIINPRYEVTGCCQGCGATYTGSGTREFVNDLSDEFAEKHARCHERPENAALPPLRRNQ